MTVLLLSFITLIGTCIFQRPRSPIVPLSRDYPITSNIHVGFKIIFRNIVSFSKNIGKVRINLSNEEDAIKDRNAQVSLFQDFKFLHQGAAKNR